MKKLLIIISIALILTGCNNTVSIDFNDKIDTNIEFSFTKDEFKKYATETKNESLDIDAIISEARPLDNSYEEMFVEKEYRDSSDKYEGEYEYTYTYDNFKDSLLLKRCFEYAAIEDEGDKYLIYLKGDSNCAPFTLKVKATNRMINNNSNLNENDTYIWNVNKKNNDIRFNISKSEIEAKSLRTIDIVYIVILIIGIVFVVIKIKNNRK